MPIGDLLDQISGGKSNVGSPSVPDRPNLPRANSIPAKRKPDNDLRQDASKASRQFPLLPTSTPSPISRAPPKKGSFAEILARGQRAQAVMGQVGKIQHKKVEKGAVKGKDESKPAAPAKGKGASGYKGTSKPVPQGSANGNGSLRKDVQGAQAPRSKAGANKRAAELETAEKKFKKAAQATTGYAGTARPKPGNPVKIKDAPRGGALLNAPMARRGSSKRSRLEDDYDEDMDDFIEYDDEEDEGGPQYGYASDGSSDMEAGMDELDVEEKRAEHLARREDIEQERLEKSLKAAKEDRKRRALEALRAGNRR
ncbi:SPT2 chromatin protein [Hirsutella rhossiliensis]|uniref:SPT2 chromatin protein n=1 Tax=Hirsutella rhossiliensis TaxID=111463 RepID=A0A9P8SJA6_9HYPO|nr:SPT2 chromatin protein [Hirsutella rhossiliensis]KAH0963500.1 SPT2 chromatin protein [Hirsutella rhossiliensis]